MGWLMGIGKLTSLALGATMLRNARQKTDLFWGLHRKSKSHLSMHINFVLWDLSEFGTPEHHWAACANGSFDFARKTLWTTDQRSASPSRTVATTSSSSLLHSLQEYLRFGLVIGHGEEIKQFLCLVGDICRVHRSSVRTAWITWLKDMNHLVEEHESRGWRSWISSNNPVEQHEASGWGTWTSWLKISRFANPLVEAPYDCFAIVQDLWGF